MNGMFILYTIVILAIAGLGWYLIVNKPKQHDKSQTQ